MKEKNILEDEYDEIYYNIFAPALTAYIRWVMEEAKKLHIRRIYFLSRDGYAMYHLAKNYSNEYPEMELRYLYVSRYALRQAEYRLMGDECLDMICSNGIEVTPKIIMKRSGLKEEEAGIILQSVAPGELSNQKLDTMQLAAFKRKLREHPDFLKLVRQNSYQRYSNVFGYLQQEDLMDNVKYATVDCGWVGTLQRSLMHLVGQEFHGFYFGLYQVPQDVNSGYFHSFYFTEKTGLKKKVYFSNCLFEIMVSAPEGMVIGYECITDKTGKKTYQPVLDKIDAEKDIRQERNKDLCIAYEKHHPSEQKEKIEKAFIRLMGKPKCSEAEILGKQKFCDDVLEWNMQCAAPLWDDNELRRQNFFRKILIKSGLSKDILHDSAWPEGSIVRTGKNVNWNLWQQRIYKYLMYLRMQILQR